MQKNNVLIFFCIVNFSLSVSAKPPHFTDINNHKVLIVNDKPILLLGVEGPTAHQVSPQQDIIDDLVWAGDNHFNVYKAVISWKWMEPSQNDYDFSFINRIIDTARVHHIKVHIVFLGFNRIGEAERFVPEYISIDSSTYQPVVDADGNRVPIFNNLIQLCTNDPETMDREKKMVEALMGHLKNTDSLEQTVVAIQIENEVCVSGITRCHCSVCNALKASSNYSDEEFYAWSIARHIDTLATAGKVVYHIPCTINSILGSDWKANCHKYRQLYLNTAPTIDLVAPDKYATSMADLKNTLNQYVLGRNIIYLSETTSDRIKSAEFFIYQILGEFGGIGQSVWATMMSYPNTDATPYNQGSLAGIKTAKAYSAINDAMTPIATYQTTNKLTWFVPTEATTLTETVNDITLNITTVSDQGKGIIVQPTQGVMDFTLVGNDYTVKLPNLSPDKSILVERGRWGGYDWIPIENVSFDTSNGEVIITMPQSCTIRARADSAVSLIDLNSSQSKNIIRDFFDVSMRIVSSGVSFFVSIKQMGNFSLNVYNTCGQNIWNYSKEDATAGYHTVSWNERLRSRIGNGNYIVILRYTDRTSKAGRHKNKQEMHVTKRFIVVR